jgi:RND superfamily putative drug exporter
VLLQSSRLTAGAPQFRAAILDAIATLKRQPNVMNVRSPLADGGRGMIGGQGRAALVQFDIRGDPDDAQGRVGGIQEAVAATQERHPGIAIAQFGDASANKEVDAEFANALSRAGLLSVAVTLIILVFAFGALVAAGIPLLLAGSAVLAAMGVLAVLSRLTPMGEAVAPIVLLIGLAVGVDYSMFYLKREREERAAGRNAEAAVNAAAATSGRSVLISGVTVIIAMAGMFVTRDKEYVAIAIGTITVVALAVVGSLTVLPAVLSKLGDNVERGRVPLLHRLRSGSGESRFWAAILKPVLRRPLVSTALPHFCS